MLILIVGLLGSGKTLLATILGKLIHDIDEIPIKSNYKTSFSELVNPLDIIGFELEDTTLLLSELQTFLDSRRSGSKLNLCLDYFFSQSRKRRVNVIADSQLGRMVDLRYRDLADYYVLAQRIENNEIGFNYTIFIGAIPIRKVFIPEEKAKMFYNDYDTEEVISPFLLARVPIEEIRALLKNSPTKKAFTTLFKVFYPMVTLDIASATYDLLKSGYEEKAEELLRRTI